MWLSGQESYPHMHMHILITDQPTSSSELCNAGGPPSSAIAVGRSELRDTRYKPFKLNQS
jgi:hypothetical protein